MGKSRKRKTKNTYLGGGSEEGYQWQLYLSISANQQEWQGGFSFVDKKMKNKHRTIYLAGGSDEGYGWKFQINITLQQQIWNGGFNLESATQKYRDSKRGSDRQWARETFPRQWLQQFEIHHQWDRGETCYFLTPEDHHILHHVTKG